MMYRSVIAQSLCSLRSNLYFKTLHIKGDDPVAMEPPKRSILSLHRGVVEEPGVPPGKPIAYIESDGRIVLTGMTEAERVQVTNDLKELSRTMPAFAARFRCEGRS